MNRESGKLRRETLNNIANVCGNLSKCRDDWESFYCAAPMSELHLRQHVNLHLHVLWRSGVNLGDLSAIIKGATAEKFGGRRRHDPKSSAADYMGSYWALQDGSICTDSNGKEDEESVLVGVVERMKKPQQVLPVSVSALIWLQSLNRCYKSTKRLDPRGVSVKSVFSFCTVRATKKDREHDLTTNTFDVSVPSIEASQLAG